MSCGAVWKRLSAWLMNAAFWSKLVINSLSRFFFLGLLTHTHARTHAPLHLQSLTPACSAPSCFCVSPPCLCCWILLAACFRNRPPNSVRVCDIFHLRFCFLSSRWATCGWGCREFIGTSDGNVALNEIALTCWTYELKTGQFIKVTEWNTPNK